MERLGFISIIEVLSDEQKCSYMMINMTLAIFVLTSFIIFNQMAGYIRIGLYKMFHLLVANERYEWPYK
jgi:hypothetical protein